MSVLKKLLVALLALILLALPLAGRWLYFYEGRYQATAVVRPDLSQIQPALPEPRPYADREIAASPGITLLDLAHDNRVRMAELNVLQARLASRGQMLEPVPEAGNLAEKLRYAESLVIISPGKDWTPDEIDQVLSFVDKGGRLLLVTDPSRFVVLYDEWDQYVGLDHDAPHINDLAARFGFTFQADYLYNTSENAGNFRNIKLSDFASHPLTDGLDELVFYAAHSIRSEEPALIATDGETRSSTSEADRDLTVGLLAADGAVLALGDLTFLTEPHNAVHDNDHFVANIADFLSNATRQHEMEDFPFFFEDQVDLVYAGEPLLDNGLLLGGSALQNLFEREGKALTVRAAQNGAHDSLIIGLYEQASEVEPLLSTAGVTLLITPTQALEVKEEELPPPDVAAPPTSDVSAATPIPEPTREPTSEPEGQAESDDQAEPKTRKRIEIQPIGEMALAGTSLLVLQRQAERTVLVVLSGTEADLKSILDRLALGDLDTCLFHQGQETTPDQVALCPTSAAGPGGGEGGWPEPVTDVEPLEEEPVVPPDSTPPERPDEPPAGILIVALDEGEARYDAMTSADDYAAILGDRYPITTWSVAQDGPLDEEDLTGYDLVVWTAGDYEQGLSEENSNLLFSMLLDGIPAILSGAYLDDTEEQAIQRDIQVQDSAHPLALGFQAGDVIEFISTPSGEGYEVGVLDEVQEEGSSIIFVRGPSSEESGIPSIVALEDTVTNFRLVYIAFPLYLLPEVAKAQLAQNAVSWLLSPE
jgi:hypothetical protein